MAEMNSGQRRTRPDAKMSRRVGATGDQARLSTPQSMTMKREANKKRRQRDRKIGEDEWEA